MITDYKSSVRIYLSDLLLSRYIPCHFLDLFWSTESGAICLSVCGTFGLHQFWGIYDRVLVSQLWSRPSRLQTRTIQWEHVNYPSCVAVRPNYLWSSCQTDGLSLSTHLHSTTRDWYISPGQWSAQSIKLSSMSVQSQWTITGSFIPSSLCLDQIKWTFAKYFLSRGPARWRQFWLGPEESWKWN